MKKFFALLKVSVKAMLLTSSGMGAGPWLQPCATRHMFCTSWVNAMSGNLLNVFDGAPCPGWRPVLARCRRG